MATRACQGGEPPWPVRHRATPVPVHPRFRGGFPERRTADGIGRHMQRTRNVALDHKVECRDHHAGGQEGGHAFDAGGSVRRYGLERERHRLRNRRPGRVDLVVGFRIGRHECGACRDICPARLPEPPGLRSCLRNVRLDQRRKPSSRRLRAHLRQDPRAPRHFLLRRVARAGNGGFLLHGQNPVQCRPSFRVMPETAGFSGAP